MKVRWYRSITKVTSVSSVVLMLWLNFRRKGVKVIGTELFWIGGSKWMYGTTRYCRYCTGFRQSTAVLSRRSRVVIPRVAAFEQITDRPTFWRLGYLVHCLLLLVIVRTFVKQREFLQVAFVLNTWYTIIHVIVIYHVFVSQRETERI